MFSYINLSGKYPPGLFASECREGKLGLECGAPSPGYAETAEKANINSGIQIEYKLLPVTALLLIMSLLFV